MGGANAFFKGTGAQGLYTSGVSGPLSGGYSGGCCQDDLRMPKRHNHMKEPKKKRELTNSSSKLKVSSAENMSGPEE